MKAAWNDDIGRRVTIANYGDNDGQSFDYTQVAQPLPGSTFPLVMTTSYDGFGRLEELVSVSDMTTRLEYDDASRLVTTIENFDDQVNGGLQLGGSQNVRTETTYLQGKVSSITRFTDGGSSTTTFEYGTTKGQGSLVSTGGLLSRIIYPDSVSGSHTEEFDYNGLNEEIAWRRGDISGAAYDELHSEHDAVGRVRSVEAMQTVSTVSGQVHKITYDYQNPLGKLSRVAQYDDLGSELPGTLEIEYNEFGQIDSFSQERYTNGADLDVQLTYGLATVGRNTSRLQSMQYPSGRTLLYKYAAAGGKHDRDLSRLSYIQEGGSTLLDMDYSGMDTIARIELPEVELERSVSQLNGGARQGSGRSTGFVGRIVGGLQSVRLSTTTASCSDPPDRSSRSTTRSIQDLIGASHEMDSGGLSRGSEVNGTGDS